MNIAHSIIIDYPINYDLYPLANNEKIYKVELIKNDYLVIPKKWFHWVYTEPNTVSISYTITDIDFDLSINNDYYESLKSSRPYKGYNNDYNISYHDFINSSLDDKYRAIISETSDCSPVIKNNLKKYYYRNTLRKIISKKKNDYIYIGNNLVNKENLLNKFTDITTVIHENFIKKVIYDYTCWFTLDKVINSGLHHDSTDNIIYVLDGKKTIYLLHPESQNNLYKEILPQLKEYKKYF